jgi:RNA polymerase sigma-70 factor (ECF subfamily)
MTTKKAQPVALNPDTYADLLPALVDGDEGAFALLYDAYAPLLFGIIVRIVGDEKEAENLLQDTFVKIWNHISKYDAEKGRLATWLINIARHIAIDFKRSKYFNQKQKNQTLDHLVSTGMELSATLPVIDTLGLKQLVERITPACREVIEWMYFDGYTQQEIADRFGIPLGTVKTRARMGLKELKEFYH